VVLAFLYRVLLYTPILHARILTAPAVRDYSSHDGYDGVYSGYFDTVSCFLILFFLFTSSVSYSNTLLFDFIHDMDCAGVWNGRNVVPNTKYDI
jgi:hypothetical protein